MRKIDYLFYSMILAAAVLAYLVSGCAWDYVLLIILVAAAAAGVVLLARNSK